MGLDEYDLQDYLTTIDCELSNNELEAVGKETKLRLHKTEEGRPDPVKCLGAQKIRPEKVYRTRIV